MRRSTRWSGPLAAALLAACFDTTRPVAPGARAPSAAISDAVHDAAGNPHFYFLPPMVPAPAATADSHVCALTSAGAVWCWGADMYGQLGNASVAPSALPVQVLRQQ